MEIRRSVKRAAAIRCLGAIAADMASEEWVRCFSEAARAEAKEVRLAALLAIGRVGWPALWPVVDERAAKEEDPALRDEALALWNAYTKYAPRP